VLIIHTSLKENSNFGFGATVGHSAENKPSLKAEKG